MSLSNSPVAYEDAYELMDKALADEKGIRAKYPTYEAACHFRMRCHQARKIDRDKNSLTYDKGHHLHGTSEYDRLTLRIRKEDDGWWLYFERNEVTADGIESLSGGDVKRDAPSARAAGVGHVERFPVSEDLGDAFEQVPVVGDVRRV